MIELLIAVFCISVFALIAGVEIPPGALAAVLVPINSADCRNEGGAGIRELYLIPFADIATMDFDDIDEENISVITLNGGASWTQYKFERDTAFFNQEKQQVGKSNLNFVPTVSVNFPNNNKETRAALRKVDRNCELVGLVVDNQGKQRIVGALPRYNQDETAIIGFFSTGFKSGAGSYNTGADSAADENIRIFTLLCNAPKEACYTSVDVTSLSLT